jgi:hypothetical protein
MAGNPKGNPQNLVGFNKMSKEKFAEIQAKGVEKARQKKKEKREMKEQLKTLLSMPIMDIKTKAELSDFGIEEKDMDNQMAITLALYREALSGNTKAYEIIRDTIGEKPVERAEVDNMTRINIIDDTSEE